MSIHRFLFITRKNKTEVEIQDVLSTFFTGLRGFHVYRSCWKPYVKQKIEFRKEKNNQYDKYAVAGYTELPGKMALCVVGHMPREISRYTWFAIEGGANITAQVVSTNAKRSPLTQGGLEIEIKVTVIWEHKKNLKIFAEKVNSVQFTLGEPYQDDTKKIVHEIIVIGNGKIVWKHGPNRPFFLYNLSSENY